MQLIMLHKSGTTWRIWYVGKADRFDVVDRVGEVDVCILFGIVIVGGCVNASNSVDEVEKIDVVGGVGVKSGDGWDDINSDFWEMIGSLWLKLSVVGNEVGFK